MKTISSITGNGLLFRSNKEAHKMLHKYNNPTTKNIRNEIINYNLKQNLKKALYKTNSDSPKRHSYETSFKSWPKGTEKSEAFAIKSSECVITSHVKNRTDGFNHFNRYSNNKNFLNFNETIKSFHPGNKSRSSLNSVYKARSTLKQKARPFNDDDSYNDPNSQGYPHKLINSATTNFYNGTAYLFPHLMNQYITPPSKSLCTWWSLKKNEYIDQLQKGNLDAESAGQDNSTKRGNEMEQHQLDTKRQFYKKQKMTYVLNRNHDKELPIMIPPTVSYGYTYSSISEKNRFIKNTEKIMKWKHFINNYQDCKKDLVKEFFNKHKIYESCYYADDKLDNFARMIKDENYQIDFRKTIQEIIDIGIGYTKDKEQNNDNETVAREGSGNEEKEKEKEKEKKEEHRHKAVEVIKRKKKKEQLMNSTFDLVNNLHEQSELYKCKSVPLGNRVKNWTPEAIAYLENQWNGLNTIKLDNNNPIDRITKRWYYEEKQKKHDEHPYLLPLRKKKLLEYIVLQQAKAYNEYKNDLWWNQI